MSYKFIQLFFLNANGTSRVAGGTKSLRRYEYLNFVTLCRSDLAYKNTTPDSYRGYFLILKSVFIYFVFYKYISFL